MRLKLILVTYIFIFAYIASFAQPELKIIDRITSADGLLSDGIKYTYKDSKGFMWFAFQPGFQRWDGYEAKTFHNFQNDTTLNSAYRFCRPFIEDKLGNLYIGTLQNGLLKFNRKTDTYSFYHYQNDAPNTIGGGGISVLYPGDNGIIWIGTVIMGISRFDPEKETFTNYRIKIGKSYPSDCNNIQGLLKDSHGTFWVGTSKGLFQFDEEKETFTMIQTKPVIPEYYNTINCIVEDVFGNIWFATGWGVFKYIHDSGEWFHLETINPDKPEANSDSYIYDIAEFYNGNKHQLWIGTMGGLKVYDLRSGVLTHFTPNNGYQEITNAGPAQYLFIDETDIMWTSMGGLTLIDLKDNPFQTHRVKSYPDSLYDTPATCFHEDDDGHLWVGTNKDGLYHFDENLNFITNYKACTWNPEENNDFYFNGVTQIYEDNDDRLWVGTGPTRLSVFDRKEGIFHPVDVDVRDNEPSQILMDPNGVVWFATKRGLFKGVVKGDYELDIALCDNPTIPKVPVIDLLYDSHDRLWVITLSSGVFCLSPENRDSMFFKRYLHKNYRHTFTIAYNARTMIEDYEEDIWFCSGKGLFKYDPELDSIVPDEYFNKNYQHSNFALCRDKNGTFCINIGAGLLIYNPNDTSQNGLRVIDFQSGLPFTSVERNDFFRDSRGYVYQGGVSMTERGFFRFHPDSIPGPNTNIPPVVLTKFNIKNLEFQLDSNITHKRHISLKHNQNFFSFEFSALDYIAPEKNLFAFMLEGLDEDWTYSGNRRFANYTGVPPGDYIFRVKASNNDGYWNEEGTYIIISISPPPWKSWWAYTLYALSLIILVIAWRRYDLKRHRLKQALEVEQVEAEKLKELDSMKSRFFANISHEFRTPLTLILGPLEKLIGTTKDKDCIHDLNMMQRNARRLQRLINQLLNLSKLEAGEMKLIAGERNIVSLVRGYVHSFESLAKQKNIRLAFSSDEERMLIYVDNDKIEKILYNLLSNAFKFTPDGGDITVSVLTHPVKAVYKEGTEGGINIIITDTGPGIPPDKIKYIFNRFYQTDNTSSGDQEGTGIGLALTQELVKLHRGNIHVDSKIGSGTSFTITLPRGHAHLKEEEIRARFDHDDYFEEIVPEVEPPSKGSQQTEEITHEKTDQPQLLIVEDNDDLRSYIRSYLEDDYMIYEAINGVRGVEMAIELVPDLVVSDVMMPKMDGYELSKKLKTDERTSHIPIILLTAKAAKADKIEGLETGADDFLTKPFDPAELLVRIKNLIEQRQKLRDYYLCEIKLSPCPDPATAESMDRQFLKKAVSMVEKNIADTELTVETYGNMLAMSRMQLHRKITALTGQTAGEFIRNLRLQKAAQLILTQKATIAEIAYDTGFTSPSYFAECFKDYFGKSPTEYLNDN